MKLKILTGILLLAIILSACSSSPSGQIIQGDNHIKVGVISIFSGDFAVVGEQVRNSIELSAKLNNISNIDFIYEDGKCDKTLSLNAAEKLIYVDKVQVIIAAGCSDSTLAIAPLANKEKVVILMPSTGGENIDNAGEYVFRTGNSDILAASMPAKDFTEANWNSVALITDQTEAMMDIRKHFLENYSGSIVLDEIISPDESDFRTIITKIKLKKPDVVFINSQTGITGAQFIAQARTLNINGPIVTNFNTATNTQSYSIAQDKMKGIYFYDPEYNQDSKKVKEFLNLYNQQFGKNPALTFHAITTADTIKLVANTISVVGNNGEKIRTQLLHIKNWTAMSGNLHFDEKGNVDLGYQLKIIDGEGKYKKVFLSTKG